MTPLTVAKLVLAGVGLVIFAYGMRADDAAIRWLGIFVVLTAWLLRFVNRRES